MSNTLTIKSISELLGEHFYIPSYQRGYRWTEYQVKELLEDISIFTKNYKEAKDKNSFYCLQPIIVKKVQWKSGNDTIIGWEVVDGQQRLTTIRILLTYLINVHLRGEKLESESHLS